MDYAHVTNGDIDHIGLPDTWARPDGSTVSGYRFLDPAEHTADGWLPIVEVRAPLAEGETHGPATYTVNGDQVTATFPAVPIDNTPPGPPAGPTPREVYDATLAQLGGTVTVAKIDAATKAALDTLG